MGKHDAEWWWNFSTLLIASCGFVLTALFVWMNTVTWTRIGRALWRRELALAIVFSYATLAAVWPVIVTWYDPRIPIRVGLDTAVLLYLHTMIERELHLRNKYPLRVLCRYVCRPSLAAWFVTRPYALGSTLWHSPSVVSFFRHISTARSGKRRDSDKTISGSEPRTG